MRKAIDDLIKKSIFIECFLPNAEHDICQSKYTNGIDYCLNKDTDESLAKIIYNNIVEYALGEFEINYENLNEEQCRAIAQNLRYDEDASSTQKLRYGFYGEVLLYSILVTVFWAHIIISKGYFYSPLEKSEPKGFDAYHLIQLDDKVELWLGEAKFRKDYSSSIAEVITKFPKTTSETYFKDNVLAIVKEKHNISTGEEIIDKLTPIVEEWKNKVLINIADELAKNNITLVYPVMIAFQKNKTDDYFDSIKRCVEEIEKLYNEGKYNVCTSLKIKVFFMFLPVDDVKNIKEKVIEWISNKEPLI